MIIRNRKFGDRVDAGPTRRDLEHEPVGSWALDEARLDTPAAIAISRDNARGLMERKERAGAVSDELEDELRPLAASRSGPALSIMPCAIY